MHGICCHGPLESFTHAQVHTYEWLQKAFTLKFDYYSLIIYTLHIIPDYLDIIFIYKFAIQAIQSTR